jgi:hypothetical protein
MNINSKLKEIYEATWPALIESGHKITDPIPTNPMLLSFDEDFFSRADKRIMICGQETWGWGDFGSSVEDCMNGYYSFFVDEEFYPGYGKSAYWKAFRFFQAQFASLYPEQKIQFIYQNLSKIGRNDGATGVTNEIRTLERQHFPVFKKEIELLQPDMILFLTGPDRDHDIHFHFPDAEFSQAGDELNLRRRAWVSSPDLPSSTLRLYHPSYYSEWSHRYKDEAVSLLMKRGEQAAS